MADGIGDVLRREEVSRAVCERCAISAMIAVDGVQSTIEQLAGPTELGLRNALGAVWGVARVGMGRSPIPPERALQVARDFIGTIRNHRYQFYDI